MSAGSIEATGTGVAMSFIRLLAPSLLLAAVASTSAYAGFCNPIPPEVSIRDPIILARVVVLHRETTLHSTIGDVECGYRYTATAFVQESAVGPLEDRLIEVHWENNFCITTPNAHMAGVGHSGWVTLIPHSEANDVFGVSACGYPTWDDHAMEILEDYTRRRAAGEGVWVNNQEFREMLYARPTLAELREAYPEVEVVAYREAPHQLLVTWFDVVEAERDSGVDLTEAFRSDQSRFIANVRDGRVSGGMFR